jgi:hypothetical protein
MDAASLLVNGEEEGTPHHGFFFSFLVIWKLEFGLGSTKSVSQYSVRKEPEEWVFFKVFYDRVIVRIYYGH